MLTHISETYEIIQKIGAGSSGEIYKAYHKNLGKYVVLKKIRADVKDLINNRAEVDVLKNLRHSCLPQVLDFLEINGDVYTVMDFIPGHSFKEYLDGGTTFKEKSVLVWARQICATLDYLHGQNPPIIHSDLKPGNIMLTPEGNICLIDFNISATLDGDTAWVTGYTAGYAAPEQVEALAYNRNELDRSLWKTIDARADIYSLGAVLYHLMTGEKPKMDESNRCVEDIRNKGIQIHEAFAYVIMKCLEPKPERRYQSARELFQDLTDIKKKDKRYRNLRRKQRIGYVVAVGFTAASVFLAVAGFFQRATDQQKQYEAYVRQETQCIASGDFEKFESYYQKAVSIYPDRLDAYYQKALALNRQRQYGDAVEFIDDEILGNEKIKDSGAALNNVYYLLGDSYEKLENYESAAVNYNKAIELDPENSDYYRDYAIALAYTGDMKKAEQALETAKSRGLNSVDINYVQGEILYNSGDAQSAKKLFLECMGKTDNDYIKMRACIMICKCIDVLENGAGGYQEKTEILENALKELPSQYNIGILEQLAQIYSDMGADTGDMSYYQKAADTFQKMKEQGMGSYDTDYNLAVLYQNMHSYDQENAVLTKMLEEYGEQYKTYKAMAFMEVAVQSELTSQERDYSAFAQYCRKAEELYQDQLENNVTDVEMEKLKELYDQAVANGWIAE